MDSHNIAHYVLICLKAFGRIFTAVSVNEKRKQTAILETVVNQCPVLCSRRNRMKLVLARPWALHLNFTDSTVSLEPNLTGNNITVTSN